MFLIRKSTFYKRSQKVSIKFPLHRHVKSSGRDAIVLMTLWYFNQEVKGEVTPILKALSHQKKSFVYAPVIPYVIYVLINLAAPISVQIMY